MIETGSFQYPREGESLVLAIWTGCVACYHAFFLFSLLVYSVNNSYCSVTGSKHVNDQERDAVKAQNYFQAS